jgi:hypothetical protein
LTIKRVRVSIAVIDHLDRPGGGLKFRDQRELLAATRMNVPLRD